MLRKRTERRKMKRSRWDLELTTDEIIIWGFAIIATALIGYCLLVLVGWSTFP